MNGVLIHLIEKLIMKLIMGAGEIRSWRELQCNDRCSLNSARRICLVSLNKSTG